jgi:hypothetical protein
MSEKKKVEDMNLLSSIDHKSTLEDGLIRYHPVFDTSKGENQQQY